MRGTGKIGMTMSCSFAIGSSPVFSPSRIPLSCKSSPETLSLTVAQHHLHASDGSTSQSPTPCSTSPFRSRSERGASAIRAFRAVDSSSPSPPPTSSGSGLNSVVTASLLKRKRPAQIHIPLAEALTVALPVGSDGRREVEAESERFSVYCKRGRKRLEMEDRHKAELDFQGDPQLVGTLLFSLLFFSSIFLLLLFFLYILDSEMGTKLEKKSIL